MLLTFVFQSTLFVFGNLFFHCLHDVVLMLKPQKGIQAATMRNKQNNIVRIFFKLLELIVVLCFFFNLFFLHFCKYKFYHLGHQSKSIALVSSSI